MAAVVNSPMVRGGVQSRAALVRVVAVSPIQMVVIARTEAPSSSAPAEHATTDELATAPRATRAAAAAAHEQQGSEQDHESAQLATAAKSDETRHVVEFPTERVAERGCQRVIDEFIPARNEDELATLGTFIVI